MLQSFVGVYPLPKINQTLKAVVEQGKLWAAGEIQPPMELRPVGPAHFYIRELQANIEFLPHKNGGMGVKITQPGAVNEGERIPAADAAIETDLLPYTGVYWSEELETQYTFFLRDRMLFGLHTHHGEFPLVPTIKDQFSSGQWFTPRVRFTRDSENHIVGVILGGGRVEGITFTRRPGGALQRASLSSTSVSHAVLAGIVGRYDYGGPILTVTEDGDHVFAQLGLQPKFEIFPKSESEFFWKVVNARVTFVKDALGRVVSATHNQNGRTFSAPRLADVAEIKLDASQTDPMLGDYDAGSAGRMTISRDAGRLYTQLTGQPRFELGALSVSELYLKHWNAQLTVVRGTDGQVTGVVSHKNGKDLEWPKLNKP